MAFAPVVLGRTGLMVNRIGLGSSYGTDRAMVEAAVERGVNYLYWGAMRTERMGAGIRAVAPAQRDRLVIVAHNMARIPSLLIPTVESNLKSLGLDYFDILLLGWFNHAPNAKVQAAARKLKERGLVRFLGISGHNRKSFPEYEKQKLADMFQIRYNAAHRGAEEEVFPYFPEAGGPGVVTFTTTRWGGLLYSDNMPSGMTPPRPRDCYRFVLSHPKVHVAIAGPNSMAQLVEDLQALAEGPMSAEELTRMRAIGDHVHRRWGYLDQMRGVMSMRMWGSSQH